MKRINIILGASWGLLWLQMIKFRTMREAIDTDGLTPCDAYRLTKVSRFLYANPLDKILELWKMLNGEITHSNC